MMEEKEQGVETTAWKRLIRVIEGGLAFDVLSAAARLGIADHLTDHPRSAAELAGALGAADAEAVQRFLRVAESIGLVRHDVRSGRYEATPMLNLLHRKSGTCRNQVLTFSAPGYRRVGELLHHTVLSGGAATRQALGADLWEYYEDHPEEAALFAGAMRDLTNSVADRVLAGYSFAGRATVVDVGGSHGVLLSRILASHPEARGILFDRPEVVEQARQAFVDQGLASRVRFVGGSFLEAVPDGGDLYLLKSVLCDWDDENCAQILSRCRDAVDYDTPLVVVDWLHPGHADTTLDWIDFMQAALVNGRVRTLPHYETLFCAAGFRINRVVKTAADRALPATVIEAFRR